MKVDTTMVLDNPAKAGDYAGTLERIGYSGAFAFEGQHDPFLPLALASQYTSNMELGTGIAVAFARNPMNLANLAYDLQLMTKGRFILGLGTQIQAHIEKRFSMQWSKPAARMKELIQAVQAILNYWQGSNAQGQHPQRLQFEGEFYQHTLMTPTFNPGENPYGTAKIFAAGVGPKMTMAVCEVADGFTIHPFNTAKSLCELTLPAIEAGLNHNPRDRKSFEISCNVIIGSGNTEEALKASREKIRKQIAFYGSTPAYKPVLDCHGWGDVQLELNRLSKQSRWDDMTLLIDDAILDAIAVVAEPDAMAEKIQAKLAGVADRVNLVARYTPDVHHWRSLVEALAAKPI